MLSKRPKKVDSIKFFSYNYSISFFISFFLILTFLFIPLIPFSIDNQQNYDIITDINHLTYHMKFTSSNPIISQNEEDSLLKFINDNEFSYIYCYDFIKITDFNSSKNLNILASSSSSSDLMNSLFGIQINNMNKSDIYVSKTLALNLNLEKNNYFDFSYNNITVKTNIAGLFNNPYNAYQDLSETNIIISKQLFTELFPQIQYGVKTLLVKLYFQEKEITLENLKTNVLQIESYIKNSFLDNYELDDQDNLIMNYLGNSNYHLTSLFIFFGLIPSFLIISIIYYEIIKLWIETKKTDLELTFRRGKKKIDNFREVKGELELFNLISIFFSLILVIFLDLIFNFDLEVSIIYFTIFDGFLFALFELIIRSVNKNNNIGKKPLKTKSFLYIISIFTFFLYIIFIINYIFNIMNVNINLIAFLADNSVEKGILIIFFPIFGSIGFIVTLFILLKRIKLPNIFNNYSFLTNLKKDNLMGLGIFIIFCISLTFSSGVYVTSSSSIKYTQDRLELSYGNKFSSNFINSPYHLSDLINKLHNITDVEFAIVIKSSTVEFSPNLFKYVEIQKFQISQNYFDIIGKKDQMKDIFQISSPSVVISLNSYQKLGLNINEINFNQDDFFPTASDLIQLNKDFILPGAYLGVNDLNFPLENKNDDKINLGFSTILNLSIIPENVFFTKIIFKDGINFDKMMNLIKKINDELNIKINLNYDFEKKMWNPLERYNQAIFFLKTFNKYAEILFVFNCLLLIFFTIYFSLARLKENEVQITILKYRGETEKNQIKRLFEGLILIQYSAIFLGLLNGFFYSINLNHSILPDNQVSITEFVFKQYFLFVFFFIFICGVLIYIEVYWIVKNGNSRITIKR